MKYEMKYKISKLQRAVCAALLTLSLLAAAVSPAYGQEETAVQESTLAVQLLTALGIAKGYEDGSLRLDQEITRAECSVLLLRAMGLSGMENSAPADTPFWDVTADHWAAAAIDTAVKIGFIEGYGDGGFGPEDPVTCEQALKMCVTAVGYQERAQERGGYPAGYLAVAHELDLTDGLAGTEQPARRGEVYSYVYQSLQAEVFESLGGGTYQKGDTLLADVFRTFRVRELVSGADYMDISKSSAIRLREDEVKLGEVKYRIGKTDIKACFGQEVTAYYQEDPATGIGKILAYEPRDRSVSRTVVDADDIVSFTYGEDATVITYEDGKRIQTARIPADAQIVYNGKMCGRQELTQPKMGSVTISRGSGAGFAVVEDYEDYVVRSILENNGYTVYAQFSKSLQLDQYSDSAVSVWLDGQRVTPAEIQPGDVVTAMRSMDGEAVTAYITRKTVTGVLSELESRDGAPYRIGINGEKYELGADFRGENKAEIPLGEERTVRLNKDGKIACVDGITGGPADGQYGYLVAAVRDTKGFGDHVEFQILSADNEILELPGADKIGFRDYNGAEERIAAVGVIDALYALSASGTESVCDVVLYETNSAGEIIQLYLPVNGTDDSRLSLDVKYGARVYSGKQFTGLDGSYVVYDNTVVFAVYDEIKYLDQFSAGAPKQYFSRGSSYQVKLFDVYNGKAGAVVYHKVIDVRMKNGLTERPAYIDNANSDVMLITDAFKTMTEDGEIVMELAGYVNGEEQHCIVDEKLEDESDIFAPGNVIQYETNYKEMSYATHYDEPIEQIVVAKRLFSVENPEEGRMYNYSDVYNTNPAIAAAYGRVTEAEETHAVLEVPDADGNMTAFPIVYQPFTYVYDAAGGARKIQPTVKEAVQVGRMVFVRLRYQTLEEVVIVE